MKIRTYSAAVLAAALMVSIPATSAWAAHRSDAEAAIAAAKAAHEKAVAAGTAAQDTAALIQQAEDLLPSRQYTKAIQIATKAAKQDTFAAGQETGGSPQGGSTEAASAPQAEAEQAIVDADAARKKAASVGGEWRDTGKMIKEAQDLVKSGEYDKAIKLANKAKRQGELGYEQALAEKDAGFPSYVQSKQ